MKLYDAHCHLSPNCFSIDINVLCDVIFEDLKNSEVNNEDVVSELGLMSTNQFDSKLVIELGDKLNKNMNRQVIIPSIGIHPWYCHLFSFDDDEENRESNINGDDNQNYKLLHYKKILKLSNTSLDFDDNLRMIQDYLPKPIYIERYLNELKRKVDALLVEDLSLNKYMICGEIGLDKLFRIPLNGFLGNPKEFDYKQIKNNDKDGSNNRLLSNFKVDMKHQIRIFNRQLEFANELKLPISVHSVKSHGVILELIRSFYSENKLKSIKSICLHSYTGSKDQIKQWLSFDQNSKIDVFFSFSNIINISNNMSIKNGNFLMENVIQEIPIDNLLIETDFLVDRYYDCNKDRDHYRDLLKVVDQICKIKCLKRDLCIEHLSQNWNRYLESNLAAKGELLAQARSFPID
ncbi:putative endodeoxyribonuclease [Ascoidea rubescens DSM 1968]|uniref:Metallo-dependent hydrolase n=1 Tax=Ascoidea rubescens DSM 1968 TaxID=1344418 RepID=A0A1D2VS89_9ASCO|nr:Metallo-dependent hydrolase [Ascoidea rubescens DSM 1968]ODV64461.1 Metallo-dependent hydrolase [Ascoidea rubescens DSM 1968]